LSQEDNIFRKSPYGHAAIRTTYMVLYSLQVNDGSASDWTGVSALSAVPFSQDSNIFRKHLTENIGQMHYSASDVRVA